MTTLAASAQRSEPGRRICARRASEASPIFSTPAINAPGSAAPNDSSSPVALSDDGRYAAFFSRAPFAAGASPRPEKLFVRDTFTAPTLLSATRVEAQTMTSRRLIAHQSAQTATNRCGSRTREWTSVQKPPLNLP